MTYERLVLTPLEIATISLGAGLGPGEDPADLGLPKLAGFEDPMALHGLQSLSVRGLMSVDSDGSVVMEPRLALLGALLADLQRCWMIALSEVEATAGGRIVGSELGHAYLQSQPLGLLTLDLLSVDVPVDEIAQETVCGFVEAADDRQAVVEVTRDPVVSPASAWLVRKTGAGSFEWRSQAPSVPDGMGTGTEAEHRAALAAFLGSH